MNVSPTQISVPLIAPSVNVQTEQAARDNRVREPVAATVKLDRSNAERRIKRDDKNRKQSAWDPAEHPSYELDPDEEQHSAQQETPHNELDRLFKLLALSSYSKKQGKSYTMRFGLPHKVLEAVLTEGKMAQRRTIIQYHYGDAVAPNTPSDVLAVL